MLNRTPDFQTRSGGRNYKVLAIAAVFWIFFGGNEIVERLLIEADGNIVSSVTTTGNRPATTYVILGANGVKTQYVAGPTDESLPRRLPEGTHIAKKKFELAWELNGAQVNDFPLYFYLGACGLGVFISLWACYQWWMNRKN